MKRYIAIFIIFLLLFLSMFITFGCGPVKIAKPTRWKDAETGKFIESMPCFKERLCAYEEQNKEAEAVRCAKWGETCKKISILEYCKDSKNRIEIKVKTRAGIIVEGDDFHAGCYDIID